MKSDHAPNPLTNRFSAPTPDDEGGLNLGQVILVLRRKALLIAGVTTVVASLAQLKAVTDVPVYSSGFEILTQAVTVESEVISSVPQTLSSRQQETNTAETSIIDTTKIRVLRSPSLLVPIVNQLKSKYPDISYETIAGGMTIAATEQNILAVSFSNEDAEFVKDVLDALSKAYLNYSLEERQKDVQQGITFVDEQLPKLEERVNEQQQKLQLFRQQYNLIAPDSQAQGFSQQSSTLNQQLLETRTNLNKARLLYEQLQEQLNQRSVNAAASALTNSPRYQKLLDQLLDIDSRLAQESALYLEESPEIQVLRDQRQNLLPLLQQEGLRVQQQVVSQIQELEYQESSLSRSINALNQQIRDLSSITREYSDIQRELQIATDNLNQFLAKREGLRIEAAQRQIPWQLLTPAGDPVPSSASVKRNLILGIILGVLLGTGVALLLDRLSDVIHTSKEVKSITKLPLLGIIPFNQHLEHFESSRNAATLLRVIETLEEGFSRTGQRSEGLASTPFKEAFRSLYTNLLLLSPDSPIRSIVISSATPNNGKSMTAIHLAQAAAAMGNRVLLVDTDLRRPSLHHYLGLDNQCGLTDVVLANRDLQDVVQSAFVEENLFILTCGSIPPDPTRILASQAMQKLFDEAKQSFDLVIYDTSPLLGFADAYLLSAHSDAMLLVVRLNYLKRSLLEQTVEELKISTAPLLGVVANGSEESSVESSSYYQYYNSGAINSNFISKVRTNAGNRYQQVVKQLKNLASRR